MATPIPPNRARFSPWDVAAAALAQNPRVHCAREGGPPSEGITTDSRAVTAGGAFVALRGERFDGHDFVAGALDRGAALVVVERGRAPAGGAADVVEVDDTLAAWGALARGWLRRWRRASPVGRVVVITGSAGKTTTKELAATLLAAEGPTLATVGNLNNRVGLPAMIFTVEPAHRFVVLEAGMSLRGEIAAMAAIAEMDVGVVTNVGMAHAAGVGGRREDVGREKGALYEALAEGGLAVANADDGAAMAQLARTRARVVTFGRAEGADVRLVARTPREGRGSEVVLARRAPAPPAGAAGAAPPLELFLPLLGEAAALDFAAALAAAEGALGGPLPAPAIVAAAAAARPTEGRATLRPLADGTLVVDDSYNANPGSMAAALESLAEVGEGRRRLVAVLGEMRELGPAAAPEHRRVGDLLARHGVSVAVGCGGLATAALARAAELGVRALPAASAAAAAALAVAEVRPGDVVLVKASRSVGAEAVVAALVESRGIAAGSGGPS